MVDDRTSYSLISAVREGGIERVINLLSFVGLSSSPAWSDGYVLLRDALQNKRTDVAKLLLLRGSKVNSKSKSPSDTPLHFAIKNGDVEIVQMLLDRSADVYARNKHGTCPLHIAVENKQKEIVELLIHQGADVNIRDRYNQTPLYLAIVNNNEEIAMLLLRRGAKACNTGRLGETPLHSAARRGYLQIVQSILQREAYVNFISRENYTPLQLAIENGHEKVVKLLLEHETNIDAGYKDSKTILYFAVEEGHPIIIDHVLQCCPDVNNKSNRRAFNVAVQGCGERYSIIVKNLLQYGFTVQPEDTNNSKLLHAVVQNGYLRIFEELFKYSTDDNILRNSTSINDSMLLHVATEYRQGEVAKLLISYGADVNARDTTGKTPIFCATENADLEMIKLLLTNKANLKDNPELLHIAVKQNCKDIVEVLLEHGADVNTTDKYGATALHYTVLNKYGELSKSCLDKDSHITVKEEIVRLLLSRGANVNARTKRGLTILHAATTNGNVKIIEALLEYNVDVNSTCENDATSLHFAAKKGNEVISKMLLDKGADINARQKDGRAALIIATEMSHKKVVELLLKCGARIDVKTRDGTGLLHIAVQKEYLEIAKLFIKFGADIDSQTNSGVTPLHIASKGGCIEIVTALLDQGADITIMTKDHYTVLDFTEAGINSFYSYCPDDSDEDYINCGRGYCAQERIAEILQCHMIKLSTANLYARNRNLLRIDGSFRYFQNECEEEIARMKSEKIDGNVSFYNILTKGISQLATYAGNENVVQVLSSGDYKMKFPIYASTINTHFRNGERRKKLLEQGYKLFHFFFHFLGLPHICTEKIFNYLSDDDLRTLMDAGKRISNDNVTSSL